MLVIKTYNEFESHLNKETVISPWHTIVPQQVNEFAKATFDYLGSNANQDNTVDANGSKQFMVSEYLTMSLIPFFWKQMVDVQNLTMQVNYGIENLLFGHAVFTGNEVRCKGSLKAIANLRGITKATFSIQLEIKDEPEPALTGEIIFLCHFI